MQVIQGTLNCNKYSGSKRLIMYVEYTITPQPDSRSWLVEASLYGDRTNVGYETTGTGTFELSLNGNKKSVRKYYRFGDDPVEVLSNSITIDEISSGKGTCRFTVYIKGYNFEFDLDTDVPLPSIDTTPSVVNVWLSGINADTATVNVTATHPNYNITSIAYFLDGTEQAKYSNESNSYNGAEIFTELSSQIIHTARVEITSSNGVVTTSEIAFQTDFIPAVTVTAEPVALTINETRKVEFIALPATSNELPRYSISDPTIATVDGSGFVTAHKVGTVTLTLTFTNISAQITVSVSRAMMYGKTRRTYVRVFDSREKFFTSGGLGVLLPSSCEVKEKLNGDYSLTLKHPRDIFGKYLRLEKENVIECPTPKGLDLFRIRKVDDTDPGNIVVTAEHLTYDANDNFVKSCNPKKISGMAAAEKLQASLAYESGITISSDIKKTGTAEWKFKNPVDILLGNDEKSFVNVYGGEAYRYRASLTMRERIGADNAFVIRHRKNLSSAQLVIDDSKVVTRLYLSGKDSEGDDLMLETPVDADNINDFPHPKCDYKAFSDIKVGAKDEDGKILYKNTTSVKNALKEKGRELFNEGLSQPACTLTVKLVAIEDTVEFDNYKALLLITLGDFGKCVLRNGKTVDLRMTEYTYDALSCRYLSITLGDAQETLIDFMNKGEK